MDRHEETFASHEMTSQLPNSSQGSRASSVDKKNSRIVSLALPFIPELYSDSVHFSAPRKGTPASPIEQHPAAFPFNLGPDSCRDFDIFCTSDDAALSTHIVSVSASAEPQAMGRRGAFVPEMISSDGWNAGTHEGSKSEKSSEEEQPLPPLIEGWTEEQQARIIWPCLGFSV